MSGKDYTLLPLGTKIGAGEIKICPHCGHHGLHELAGGTDWYTHAETLDPLTLKVHFVMCPKIASRA
jgi:hypothetical protein